MLNYKDENGRWRTWHLGGGDVLEGQVVEFQADGHELQMIHEAMRRAMLGRGQQIDFGPDEYRSWAMPETVNNRS